jgi:hypothetical protein
VGIRVEVTQNEHEMLRIENNCGREQPSKTNCQRKPTADYVRSCGSLVLKRENSEVVNLFV